MDGNDQTLCCAGCGETFVFTAGEQQFFARRAFRAAPKWCARCRSERKRPSIRQRPTQARETFAAVCSLCGGGAEVSFRPAQGRPVTCASCRAMRVARGSAQW